MVNSPLNNALVSPRWARAICILICDQSNHLLLGPWAGYPACFAPNGTAGIGVFGLIIGPQVFVCRLRFRFEFALNAVPFGLATGANIRRASAVHSVQ